MASGTIKAVVGRSDIVNNLTTNDSTKVLSAAQGKALKDAADTLNSKITKVSSAYSFGNTTLSSIESAIVTYANSMDDNESVSIKFRVNPASGVFAGTTYAGTLYRNGSGVYVVTVSGIQDPTQFVNGVYTNGAWSWNAINSNFGGMSFEYFKDTGLTATAGTPQKLRTISGSTVRAVFKGASGGGVNYDDASIVYNRGNDIYWKPTISQSSSYVEYVVAHT